MNLENILGPIQEKAASVDPIGNTLKFSVGDTILYIDGTGDANTVSTEDKEADCTVNVSAEDLQGLMDGSLNPMMAFMSGKIKIDGDMGVAMKLQTLLG